MGSRLDADQIVQKFAIQLLMEAVRDHVGSKLDAKAGFIIGVGSGILIYHAPDIGWPASAAAISRPCGPGRHRERFDEPWRHDFAMSRPIVAIVCMTWLLRIVGAILAPTSVNARGSRPQHQKRIGCSATHRLCNPYSIQFSLSFQCVISPPLQFCNSLGIFIDSVPGEPS